MSHSHDKGYRAEHAVELLYQAQGWAQCYRPRAGSQDDVGDIGGIPVVTSVKNHGRLRLGEWCDDLVAMVARAGVEHGAVWLKRVRRGDPLDWFVLMPARLYLPVLSLILHQGGTVAPPPDTAPAARVRALHRPVTGTYSNAPEIAVCSYCTSGGDPYCYPDGANMWPCPTILALDGDLCTNA